LRLDIPQAETPAPPPAAQSAWRTLGESEPKFGEIVLVEDDGEFATAKKYTMKRVITESGENTKTETTITFVFENIDGLIDEYISEERWCPIPKK
jgi:hypothetical protein